MITDAQLDDIGAEITTALQQLSAQHAQKQHELQLIEQRIVALRGQIDLLAQLRALSDRTTPGAA